MPEKGAKRDSERTPQSHQNRSEAARGGREGGRAGDGQRRGAAPGGFWEPVRGSFWEPSGPFWAPFGDLFWAPLSEPASGPKVAVAGVWSPSGPEIDSGTGAPAPPPQRRPKAPRGIPKSFRNRPPNGTPGRPRLINFGLQKRVPKEASKRTPEPDPELDPERAVAAEWEAFGPEIGYGRGGQKGSQKGAQMVPKRTPRGCPKVLPGRTPRGPDRSTRNRFKPAPVEREKLPGHGAENPGAPKWEPNWLKKNHPVPPSPDFSQSLVKI